LFHFLPKTERLPYALYSAAQSRALDQAVIQIHGIAGVELMERAGRAAYTFLRHRWPDAREIALLCGGGNNGGDGYVVARLARADGLRVRLFSLVDPEQLRGEARAMAERWREAGGAIEPFETLPKTAEVLLDALLGTGLERPVAGRWAEAVEAMNAHRAPALALDIPSGLHADTGRMLGTAARCDATISFIALKAGLFTASGPACAGEMQFDALGVPAQVYSREIPFARRLDWPRLSGCLGKRSKDSHKGDYGHVLLVGGAPGFSGAVRLAGEGALRTGAGLVSIATHPDHAAWLNLNRPELMVHGIAHPRDLSELLSRATAVAIGPGLGTDAWGEALLEQVLSADLPLVVDADGLNLLAQRTPVRRDHWILTPHPGEAARLLACETSEIQADRFSAARRLQETFGAVVVLKGSGTLVAGPSHRPLGVCSQGNPGMASGGMGDVLTGILAALLAQGLDGEEAASVGACLHGAAGDLAAEQGGERGLLASDLLEAIRPLLNGKA